MRPPPFYLFFRPFFWSYSTWKAYHHYPRAFHLEGMLCLPYRCYMGRHYMTTLVLLMQHFLSTNHSTRLYVSSNESTVQYTSFIFISWTRAQGRVRGQVIEIEIKSDEKWKVKWQIVIINCVINRSAYVLCKIRKNVMKNDYLSDLSISIKFIKLFIFRSFQVRYKQLHLQCNQ